MIGTARLTGPRPRLDPRQSIARPDLVDLALAGSVAAARYVVPASRCCSIPRTPVRNAGDATAAAVSELLFGEGFDLFELAGDWAFGRSVADGYSGWVPAAALGDRAEVPMAMLGAPVAMLGAPMAMVNAPMAMVNAPMATVNAPLATVSAPMAMVSAVVAPVFAAADIKAPVLMELPFGARLAGVAGDCFLALAAGGFVHLRHVAPPPPTPIAVARIFTGAPYLWGGRTPLGADCSGLVQAALAACGIACPRDSDQQLAGVGAAVDYTQRMAGDLVFFPGHVGILVAGDRLLHANAHWMAVVEEPLAAVIARLAAAGVAAPVSGVRRLGGQGPVGPAHAVTPAKAGAGHRTFVA